MAQNMVECCAVPYCSERKGGFKIPSEKIRQKEWLKAIRRDDYLPSMNAFVCKNHFTPQDYTFRKGSSTTVILKKSAVPSRFSWNYAIENMEELNTQFIQDPLASEIFLEYSEADSGRAMSMHDLTQNNIKREECEEPQVFIKQEVIIEDQGWYEEQQEMAEKPVTVDRGVQMPAKTDFYNHGFLSVISADEYIRLTGFEPYQVDKIYRLLNLDTKDVGIYGDFLFITFAIYKHKIPLEMASTMFNTDIKTIKRIFERTTDTLYERLNQFNFWDHRLQKPLRYNAIFNSIEIQVTRSADPLIRNLTESQNMRNKSTFKCLVVTDERDYIIFCSNLYGGCTSGRKIVMDSGILERLEPEDCILTDKEFIIHDFCSARNIGMEIALFLNSKIPSQICRAHKHLEDFEILVRPMEEHFWCIANKIMYNCMMLMNFKKKFWKEGMNSQMEYLKTMKMDKRILSPLIKF